MKNKNLPLGLSIILGTAILSFFFISPQYFNFSKTSAAIFYIFIIAFIGSFPVLIAYYFQNLIYDNWLAFWSGAIAIFVVASLTLFIFNLYSWWDYSSIDFSFRHIIKDTFSFTSFIVSLTFATTGAFGGLICNCILNLINTKEIVNPVFKEPV